MQKSVLLILVFIFSVTLSANRIISSGHKPYKQHLQGIAADTQHIFWSFTTFLLKTDYRGKFVKQVPIPYHSGDICMVDGDIFVATDHRTKAGLKSNGNRKSAVLRFNKNLELVKSYPIEPGHLKIEGITFFNGKFYVGVGNTRELHRKNDILILDRNFKLLKQLTVDIGCDTRFGVQNLFVSDGLICGGFYGGQSGFCFDPENLNIVKTFPVKPTVGIEKLHRSIAGNDQTWLVGGLYGKKGCYYGLARIYKITGNKRIPVKFKSLKLSK